MVLTADCLPFQGNDCCSSYHSLLMTKCEKNLIRLKLSQISNGYTYNPAIYIYINYVPKNYQSRVEGREYRGMGRREASSLKGSLEIQAFTIE